MSAATEFPDQLRELVAALGLTHDEFAEVLGVTRGALQHWLAGKYEPEPYRAERIATAADRLRRGFCTYYVLEFCLKASTKLDDFVAHIPTCRKCRRKMGRIMEWMKMDRIEEEK